mmetsp:Transcript_53166/g.108444  ORF Transcript_53166/g.108444 Transcript_53166/m.108444 type:complete len:224 (+) Transcript_53166:615-1286(+)
MVASEKPHCGAWRVPLMNNTARYLEIIRSISAVASSSTAPSLNSTFAFALATSEAFLRQMSTSLVFPGGASPVRSMHCSIHPRAVSSSSLRVGFSHSFILTEAKSSAGRTCRWLAMLSETFRDIATYCMSPSLSKHAYTPGCAQLSGSGAKGPPSDCRLTDGMSSRYGSAVAFNPRIDLFLNLVDGVFLSCGSVEGARVRVPTIGCAAKDVCGCENGCIVVET